jgi:hypothetical protein
MPLTLTLTENVLPKGTEKQAFVRLCEAMLRWHGLAGNRVITPNVVGSLHVLPRGQTFAGLEEGPVAFVEWKMPSFTFATREIQLGYVKEATDILHDASGGQHPRDRIWVNVSHAVDGAWGINGVALTNAQLGEAVARG